jgi:uncharacterized membrane protein
VRFVSVQRCDCDFRCHSVNSPLQDARVKELRAELAAAREHSLKAEAEVSSALSLLRPHRLLSQPIPFSPPQSAKLRGELQKLREELDSVQRSAQQLTTKVLSRFLSP